MNFPRFTSFIRLVLSVSLVAVHTQLAAQVITTVAGSSLKGDGGLATGANLSNPVSIAVDGSGNLYIVDQGNHRIRKVTPAGSITTVVGNGAYGFSGDGGQATSASLANAAGVAVDGSGNLYIADSQNNRVRKVTPAGSITTVAGTGTAGFSGDGDQATSARLANPTGVAVDGAGNLYIADQQNHRIRKVDALGIITTVAGSATAGYGGDGGLATVASLNSPTGVSVDGSGNLYIADSQNNRIRKVLASGTIATVAGDGTAGFGGDSGLAITASLNNPFGISVDGSGNLFIADASNHRIRMVTAGGIISTVAGDGTAGYNGDSASATTLSLYSPKGVATDGTGNLYIADSQNNRLRNVSTGGIMTTVAGNGTINYGGDGGPATLASLSNPFGLAVDASGNLYIADQQNQRIRKISASGIITTVVGNGAYGFSGDGGLATGASLANAAGIAIDGSGNLFIADQGNNRIRKITPAGSITTVAGNGTAAFGGDGGAAIAAKLNFPAGVAIDSNGNLYIADSQNNRVRKVTPAGSITTVAGTGTAGFGGDGGAATAAKLNYPAAVAIDGTGNLYIADQGNHRIRKVTPAGSITTVAGNGTFGFGGDGGPATAANLANPADVVLDAHGNLYIDDSQNNRIRKVLANGTIITVAGNEFYGFSGDGGPATAASLANPLNVAIDSNDNLYIADTDNQRVRKVAGPAIVRISPANPVAVCSGTLFSLTATTANFTPSSYTWTSQPTGLSATGATATFTAPTVNTPTVYTLTATATDGASSPIASVTLAINPIPSLTVTASPSPTITSGQSTTLTASGATSYLWSTSATSTSIVITTSGVYSVTGTSLGCSSSTSLTTYGIIASVQDGNWSSASTWNCNCVPGHYDGVTISVGHHVTVSQAVQAKQVTQNGTLFLNTGGKISF
ncbi:NHL domain-containing protein [Spirosoma gilvum]